MISLNDVLLAASNIPVDDPIAEIWGRGLQGGDKIIEYTGTFPITITANGDALIDYRIYGADGGVGVATENLIDADNPGTQRVELEPNTDYCLCKYTGSFRGGKPSCYVYDENGNQLFGDYIDLWVSYSFTNPSNGAYAIISFNRYAKGKLSFVKGRAANNSTLYPANYIPHGYKLPMTVGNGDTAQTVPVYIGENQLGEDEYISFSEQKIYKDVSGTLTPTDPPVPLPEIPTIDGTTVIDYDGDPKPSQMYVKYKGKG